MENTDLRLLTDMLKRADVTFCVYDRTVNLALGGVEYEKRVMIPGDGYPEGLIETHEGDPKRTTGYASFQSEFYFDASGQLVAVGAWE